MQPGAKNDVKKIERDGNMCAHISNENYLLDKYDAKFDEKFIAMLNARFIFNSGLNQISRPRIRQFAIW